MADRQFGLCYWCRLPMLPADDPAPGMEHSNGD